MAGAVHVEEGDDIGSGKVSVIDVNYWSWQFADDPHRDVTGNNREWDADKTPVMDVDVRSADFGVDHFQQRTPRNQLGGRKFLEPDRLVRPWHDNGGERFRGHLIRCG